MADSMKILEGIVRAAGARHGVLASNIANADTPGYRAKDIKFEHALDAAIELEVTSAGHMKAGDGTGQAGRVEVVDSRPWADGNSVELDLEVAKMTENAMLFQAGVSMLSTKIKMFKNALRTR